MELPPSFSKDGLRPKYSNSSDVISVGTPSGVMKFLVATPVPPLIKTAAFFTGSLPTLTEQFWYNWSFANVEKT